MSKLSDEDIRHLVEITDDMAENSEAEGDSDADDDVPIHLLETEEGEANNSSLASDMSHESGECGPQEAEENDEEEGNVPDSLSDDEDFHWDRVVSPPPQFSNTNFMQPCGISHNAAVNLESPLEIFMLLLTPTFMEYIVAQSNVYATQKNASLDLTVEELKAFLGILIIMGFNTLPSLRLFWSTDTNFHIERIACIMPLKRFLKILRFLHLNDNAQPQKGEPNYKTHKVKPIIDHVNKTFRLLFNPSRYLAVDESMIKFKGRSSLKQYMPMKPVKRGFKMWVLACSVTGYCLAVSLYEGKDGSTGQSLGERVVNKLIEGYEGFGYCLFFDNFFSNLPMIKRLLQKKYFACSTIRQTRKFFPHAQLRSDKDLKIGESDFIAAGDIGVAKWKDRGKKCVCIATTMHNVSEKAQVLRTNKEGKRESVSCPTCIKDYNAYMGGVDHFDQLVSAYNISWKSRKWWIKIFYYCIDAMIVNAYILYKTTYQTVHPRKKCLTHLKFRSLLANELVGSFYARQKKGPTPQKGRGRKRNHPDGRATLPNATRLANVGEHLPLKGTRRRCAYCSTSKEQRRSNIQCMKCNVALCLECFAPFHKS